MKFWFLCKKNMTKLSNLDISLNQSRGENILYDYSIITEIDTFLFWFVFDLFCLFFHDRFHGGIFHDCEMNGKSE